MNGTQSVITVLAQAIVAIAVIAAVTVLVAIGKLDASAGIAIITSELGVGSFLSGVVIHRQTPNLAKMTPTQTATVAKAIKGG